MNALLKANPPIDLPFVSLDLNEQKHQQAAITAISKLRDKLQNELEKKLRCDCVFPNESVLRNQFRGFLDEHLRMERIHAYKGHECGGGRNHFRKRLAKLNGYTTTLAAICFDEEERTKHALACDDDLELQCEVLERSVQEMQAALDAQPALKRQKTTASAVEAAAETSAPTATP